MTKQALHKTIPKAQLSELSQLDPKYFSCDSDFIFTGDSRFDATAYSAEAWKATSAINAVAGLHAPLGSLCGTIWHPVQNQARSNFKRIYVEKEHGRPYVGSREMFFLPLRPDKFLSKKIPKLQDLMVPEGWLLISRSGTVGNVLYVYKRLSKCAITDHAIRIEPVKVPAGFLYAFLTCKYGQPLIAQGSYGSTVDELEPKHIASIPVPLFDHGTQQKVNAKIIQAYDYRDRANELLDEAEAELYKVMGVEPFDESDIEYLGDPREVKAFEIDSSEIENRFDATNHIPLVRSAIHKLQESIYVLTTLGLKCPQIIIPARFKRNYVPQESGVPYLLPAQLNLIRPDGVKAIAARQAAESPEYLLKEGELLLTTDGTVGRVNPVTRRMIGWFGSNNFARLWDATTDMGFIYAFLSTPFGNLQVCKDIYGGVIDHINESQIAAVQLPDVPSEKQRTVGNLVREAFELKDRANDLEDEAIGIVEHMIGG